MSSDADARAEAERRFGGTASGNPPTTAQRALNEAITEEFIDLAAKLYRELPPGRELSTALTHLETAKMFAVKAVFA